jgi:RNA polymerase sigma-70 factor (ECF subfamily)
MTTSAISAPGGQEFARLAEPLRRELLAHCYRLLGSAHDAEDAVQETLLRAWRAYDRFEGRSSLRVWLYQIATNACLRALEQRGRRAMPSDLGAASDDPRQRLELGEVTWLQPLPTDPADVATARSGVRLAFVAALQHLPARQRAVLILRDVLRLPAADAADILGTSAGAVHSALRRARSQLAEAAPSADGIDDLTDPGMRELLNRYVEAFHAADLVALERVLRDDVALEMPPYATWFAGRATVLGFFGRQVLDRPGRVRLLPTVANGQPAFAAYLAPADGSLRAHGVHVLDVTPTGVRRIHVFLEPELLAGFGFPAVHRDEFPERRGSEPL